MDLVHVYETEQRKPTIALSGVGKGSRGRDGGGDLTNVQCIGIVTMNPPCITNIS
jgi:hypothetical protein